MGSKEFRLTEQWGLASMSQQQWSCDHRFAESAIRQERVSGLRQVRNSVVHAGLSPRILTKATPLSFACQMRPELWPAQRRIINISELIIKAAIRLCISLALLMTATFHSFGHARALFFESKGLTVLN